MGRQPLMEVVLAGIACLMAMGLGLLDAGEPRATGVDGG